jgi:hypothetical protein
MKVTGDGLEETLLVDDPVPALPVPEVPEHVHGCNLHHIPRLNPLLPQATERVQPLARHPFDLPGGMQENFVLGISVAAPCPLNEVRQVWNGVTHKA